MYPMSNDQQITFEDFNQAFGMNLSRNNEWYLLAKKIDWKSIEKTYSQNFPLRRGHPAFSARIALGSLIIQKRTGFSDRALVKAIAENPYYQFFIGFTKFTNQCPFTATSLVIFRKCLGHEVIMQCNAALIVTRLSETTLTSIALSVFVANLFAVPLEKTFFVVYFADVSGMPGTSYFCDFWDNAS